MGLGTVAGSILGGGANPATALVGSIIGKLGTTALAFGLDSIFGWSSDAEKEVQDALNRQAMFARNTTLQNESNAATQGLRNIYNETHKAAKGKNPGERWSTGDYTKIQTPSGPTYGAMQGLAQPAEGEVDMLTGETHYNGSPDPNVKDSKKDIVPVGSANGDGDYFDKFVFIPGKHFADLARPHFKANE